MSGNEPPGGEGMSGFCHNGRRKIPTLVIEYIDGHGMASHGIGVGCSIGPGFLRKHTNKIDVQLAMYM
jgi:hypothetical protein